MLQRCKSNILKQFHQIRSLPKNLSAKSCVLVLDTITAPILSQLISMEELLEAGIKDLLRVDKIKKPEPSAAAIYYIGCESLKFMYRDFEERTVIKEQEEDSESSERSAIEKQAKQGAISLFFSINLLLCEQASQKVLKQISDHESVLDRIASFGELYVPCRYVDNNLALIPFSPATRTNVQTLRNLSKDKPSPNMPEPNTINSKEQQKSEVSRHRNTTAHHSYQANLSCLADILAYNSVIEIKNPGQKDKSRRSAIDDLIHEYGRKICESIIAGLNIGFSTVVKIVCYESKFSNKVKEGFSGSFLEYMESKAKQINEAQQKGDKNSLFYEGLDQAETKQLVVIISDRFLDTLSPLVRSFLYQPLIFDAFEVKDPPQRKIKIISRKIAPTVVDKNDTVFCKYRDNNVFQAFLKIDDDLQEFIVKNKAAQFQKQIKTNKQQQQFQMEAKPSTATQMRDVIGSLAEYKKITASFNVNIDILKAIASIKTEKKLDELAELEHMIVTGYNKQNKVEKDKKILEKLNIALQNAGLSSQDRCRLLVLGICCLDISNDDRDKLTKRLSQIEGQGDIAIGLSKLGRGVKKYTLSSHASKNPKQAHIDKHQCILSCILEQLLHSGASKIQKNFKLQQLKISANLKKPILKGSLSKHKSNKTEYVAIMCGGMGYNQISDVQRMFKSAGALNSEISFITDYLFSPTTYLQELCTML